MSLECGRSREGPCRHGKTMQIRHEMKSLTSELWSGYANQRLMTFLKLPRIKVLPGAGGVESGTNRLLREDPNAAFDLHQSHCIHAAHIKPKLGSWWKSPFRQDWTDHADQIGRKDQEVKSLAGKGCIYLVPWTCRWTESDSGSQDGHPRDVESTGVGNKATAEVKGPHRETD